METEGMEKKVKVPKLRFPGFTDEWEQRKLGEFAQRQSETRMSDNEVPCVEYEDVIAEQGVLNKNIRAKENNKTGIVFSEDDVLYGKLRPYLHNWLNPDFKGVAVGDWWVLKPQDMDKNFLYRLLQTHQFDDAANQSTGTKMPRADWKLISNLEFRVPGSIEEQAKLGKHFNNLDNLITLHQRKLTHLQAKKTSLLQKMFPKRGECFPELRFPGFTDAWEQCKLGEVFERVNERNDGSFDKTKWISVAKMFFQVPEKVQSNNLDTRTYVMREGDIAFEGHPNKEFQFGRFVANDIGAGVVSELFPIYRHIDEYDSYYWKYAIQLEWIMAPIFAKAITSSGNSSNKLDTNHFLRQSIRVPNLAEQKKIGECFSSLDHLITLHQRKLAHLQTQKKALLQQMFV